MIASKMAANFFYTLMFQQVSNNCKMHQNGALRGENSKSVKNDKLTGACNKREQKNEPCHEKTCFMPYANNKGADQPAHLRSLISAFVVHCLDSMTSLVSIFVISLLSLASVAEQASLY